MNTMNIPLYIIDAFAEQAYSGNPAAVCLLEHPVDEGYMQKTAAEMNLSETAFLWPEEDGYRLRWFTPKVEVKLCGHGTLASAHVLWESGLLAPDMEARFYTRSGLLRASRSGDLISLYFPPYQLQPSPVISGLQQRLVLQKPMWWKLCDMLTMYLYDWIRKPGFANSALTSELYPGLKGEVSRLPQKALSKVLIVYHVFLRRR